MISELEKKGKPGTLPGFPKPLLEVLQKEPKNLFLENLDLFCISRFLCKSLICQGECPGRFGRREGSVNYNNSAGPAPFHPCRIAAGITICTIPGGIFVVPFFEIPASSGVNMITVPCHHRMRLLPHPLKVPSELLKQLPKEFHIIL